MMHFICKLQLVSWQNKHQSSYFGVEVFSLGPLIPLCFFCILIHIHRGHTDFKHSVREGDQTSEFILKGNLTTWTHR